jgi:polyketide synthase 12/myxalamid-type polyketide synthase MxaF
MDQNTISELDRGTAARTQADIKDWIIGYVSRLLAVERSAIDSAATFDQLGMDSMMVIVMTEELGTWVGRSIEPTSAYDHPSIDRFAKYVAGAAA